MYLLTYPSHLRVIGERAPEAGEVSKDVHRVLAEEEPLHRAHAEAYHLGAAAAGEREPEAPAAILRDRRYVRAGVVRVCVLVGVGVRGLVQLYLVVAEVFCTWPSVI